MQYTEKEKEIIRYIGYYYLENSQNQEEAKSNLSLLDITNISYKDNEIKIVLGRPGFLIGSKGNNLTNLKKYLSDKLKQEIKIKIVENNLKDYLFGFIQCYDFNIDDDSDIDNEINF